MCAEEERSAEQGESAAIELQQSLSCRFEHVRHAARKFERSARRIDVAQAALTVVTLVVVVVVAALFAACCLLRVVVVVLGLLRHLRL